MAASFDPGIELWTLRVDAGRQRFDSYWQCLAPGERQQADAYHQAADCQRFVIARGSLRRLLGWRLGLAPEQVEFDRGEFGKPRIAAHPELQFNTSHSGDWVLHAISTGTPVGVDVEARPADALRLEELDAALAPQELGRLRGLPIGQQSAALTELWVCKEAYVKAIGEGLSRPLGGICIAPLPGGGHALVHDHAGAALSWNFEMIDVGPVHAACLAYAGPARRVRIRSDGGELNLKPG